MGQPAAKQGDKITASDTHVVLDSNGVSSPLAHRFEGLLTGELSDDVKIMGLPAARVGSTADNFPKHVPTPPGMSFLNAPSNKGTIQSGSTTVRINGKAAARDGDPAETCSEGPPVVPGKVVVTPRGTVNIG